VIDLSLKDLQDLREDFFGSDDGAPLSCPSSPPRTLPPLQRDIFLESSTEGDGGRGVGLGEGGVSRGSSRTPSDRAQGSVRTEGRTVAKEENERGGLVCMRETESER